MAGRLEGLPDRGGALTALYGAPPRRADRVLASIPTRRSVWPDNGSQRLGRTIGQFDPDTLLKPVFDYASRAQNVVPFDLLNDISQATTLHSIQISSCKLRAMALRRTRTENLALTMLARDGTPRRRRQGVPGREQGDGCDDP